ncbi:hypothetical protein K504DRAFT_505719 [Pleomassaria siparia CBS 279.74]|uniref:Uncharacterized protein n=1 Tax=Pleomassaria siparia CBS 279.74 TaxID=1314801 RepID=A0A6G1K0F9_9PLEO|nr:hypothetical protein K504DRAFT_505719 [Pleomassaria siparia CBS 279.74]
MGNDISFLNESRKSSDNASPSIVIDSDMIRVRSLTQYNRKTTTKPEKLKSIGKDIRLHNQTIHALERCLTGSRG